MENLNKVVMMTWVKNGGGIHRTTVGDVIRCNPKNIALHESLKAGKSYESNGFRWFFV